jgi:hypothetical protein
MCVSVSEQRDTGHGVEGPVRRPCRLGLLYVAMLALAGCGGSDLAPVVGKVTFNGEPIKKGHIVMEPLEGRSARGTIIDGSIVDLHTYELGDGVRVGQHKVSIIAFVREPKGMEVPPSLIPHRYETPSSSGLTAMVEAGKTNELVFELTD